MRQTGQRGARRRTAVASDGGMRGGRERYVCG